MLDALLRLVEPGETWIDIGAGAGRYALPIALALAPSGGRVIALDASPGMLDALLELQTEHGVTDVEVVETRWPPTDGMPLARFAADVALIAHVGYDIESIGPFVRAMESVARRLCVAVLMERQPASIADACWPPVHGEARVALPALPDFVELLRARGREPSVEMLAAGAASVRLARRARRVPAAAAVDRARAGRRTRASSAALDELLVVDDGWRGRAARPAAVADRRRDLGPARGGGMTATGRAGRPADGRPVRSSRLAGLADREPPDLEWRLPRVVAARHPGGPACRTRRRSRRRCASAGSIRAAANLDEERSIQWFAPRRARSGWARSNKERVARLTAAGLMLPAGLAAIEEAKRNGMWTLLDDVENLIVPDDLAAALAEAPPPASAGTRSRPARAGRCSQWIVEARRPETRAGRIERDRRRAAARNERAYPPG